MFKALPRVSIILDNSKDAQNFINITQSTYTIKWLWENNGILTELTQWLQIRFSQLVKNSNGEQNQATHQRSNPEQKKDIRYKRHVPDVF